MVLAGRDVEHTGLKVDVGTVQRERFAQPQTGAGQQPDHGRERGRGQWPGQRPRGGHQVGDLLLGVDVGGRAWLVGAQQVRRGNLGRRIDGGQVAGEAPHRR